MSDNKEAFKKIVEALNRDSTMAWYDPIIGSMECQNTNPAPPFGVVESFFVNGSFCNNDSFILEALNLLTFGTSGMISDVMNLMKKQGESVTPLALSSIDKRLSVFTKVSLVFKFSYNDCENKVKTVYSLTSMGLSVWKKVREKHIKKYDMNYNLGNRAHNMMFLSSSYVAIAYALLIREKVPVLNSNYLIDVPDASFKEYYFAKVQTVVEPLKRIRNIYFETVFFRPDGLVATESRISTLLERLKLFIKLFLIEKDIEEDAESKIVLIIENKRMLDDVVKLLNNNLPEIFEYVWFTSTNIVKVFKKSEIPFIYISTNTIVEDERGNVTYKVGRVDDKTYF